MLYFEPFMGNNGQLIHIPAYTYKSWANKLYGASSEPPGFDDEKTMKQNLTDMIARLRLMLKDVSKSLSLIWDTMRINNITFEKPVYTVVEASGSPIFTGFTPWLLVDGTTATAFALWSLHNLPLIASRNGNTPGAGENNMTFMEGADYLLRAQIDISMTLSVLSIMKNYY